MKIDKTALCQEFDKLAKSTLRVVSASSLKLFTLEVENIAKRWIRSSIEKEYNQVSTTLNGDTLSKFLDLSKGYLVSMNEWINKSKIKFPSIPVMEEPDEVNASANSLRELVKRKEVQAFGCGTALSIILFLSGVKIIAFVTEAIAAAAGLYLYKQSNIEKTEIKNKAKDKFEKDVNQYIDQVIEKTLSWVDTAERESDNLIFSYK